MLTDRHRALPGTADVPVCKKILKPFLDLCVSSLREGHANLLCIVSNLTDVAGATRYTENIIVWGRQQHLHRTGMAGGDLYIPRRPLQGRPRLAPDIGTSR